MSTSPPPSTDPRKATGAFQKPPKFTADERNAMRSYVQRAEVRLSTLHRVAVGFLSGAGLLFLLPVFLKDGVLAIMVAILNYSPTLPDGSPLTSVVGVIIVYLCLLYPFVISLAIPAAALFLLFKDIVRFYFVGHPPNFPDELFNPRFVLTGVAFSPDESEEVKARVLRYQYGTDLINFVISRADSHSRYYSGIIDKPHRMIVPRTRKLPRLIKMGVLDVPTDKPLDELDDDDIVRVHGIYHHGDEDEMLLNTPYVERTLKDIDRFNAALGLAGFYDRSLYQEVAKAEVSVVRHALKLRTLVLRYFQALLIMIWTSVITFMMLPFLNDERQRFPVLLVFAIAYFVWALLAPLVVQLPLYWLVRTTHSETRKGGMKQYARTDALQTFGKWTQRLCYIALATSLLALVLEVALSLTT